MSRWLILRKWLIYKAAKIYLIADLVVGNEFPPRTAQIPRFPPVPHRSKSRINTHKRGKKKISPILLIGRRFTVRRLFKNNKTPTKR